MPNKQKGVRNKKSDKATTGILGAATFLRGETLCFLLGLLLLIVSIYLILAFVSNLATGGADQSFVENNCLEDEDISAVHNYGGALGARVAYFFMQKCFGLSSFFIPIFFIFASMKLMRAYKVRLWKWFLNCTALMIWSSVALSFFIVSSLRNQLSFSPGGQHGDYICRVLSLQIGKTGLFMLLLFAAVAYLIYITRETMNFFRKMFRLRETAQGVWGKYGPHRNDASVDENQEEPQDEVSSIEPVAEDSKEENSNSVAESIELDIQTPSLGQSQFENPANETPELGINKLSEEEKARGGIVAEKGLYDPTKDLENYHFPKLDLLQKYASDTQGIDMEEQNANKEHIIAVLRSFDIGITSIRATVGPTVTLYEIVPGPGVRISQIKSRADDIALSLKAIGVRIIAPMPGKGTVGIEVPNKKAQIVSMESILNSRKFQETNMTLPIALGKTITNEVFMVDLAKLPHLLVAGATGQGKSVGLNAIITSLLYKKHPSELKFVMIDPKKVELSIYSPIENHFLAKIAEEEGDAIITDVTKVIRTLKSLCVEMDQRYDLLKKAHVRNVKEYNEKFKKRELNPENGHKFMPYIVVIIDEFGDLIMTAGKEIELPIARIAQLARAVGIHMVIATQRPTTNIITGTIKANFPARMAFKVASATDSQTILGSPGAKQLVGRGDMLFLSGTEPVRVQCAFVDTPEVERINDYISKQQGYLTAFELPPIADGDGDGGGSSDSMDPSHMDPMFEQAARLVVIHQQGSTSLIQRKFSIGYNRAGRIMDQLERAGVVGPSQGAKPRDVLCADEVALDNLINNLKA